MFDYLNLVIFYRIKVKLDQGGVIQDFINALEQLSNPEMIFKVILHLLTHKTQNLDKNLLTIQLDFSLFFFPLAQDWTDDIKVELTKNPVNKKTIEKMYERMYAALGDSKAAGLGAFRRKFIQVWVMQPAFKMESL